MSTPVIITIIIAAVIVFGIIIGIVTYNKARKEVIKDFDKFFDDHDRV
jgi:uncharacterized protein YneF (UPF0154 family)